MRARLLDGEMAARDLTHDANALVAYLADVHARWLAADPNLGWQGLPGSLVFADVSGFTPLTERLARRGKVGAEELTDVLNAVFRELLAVAGGFGGDCLKFGGDALLLLFTGDDHPRRACAAAAAMLHALGPFHRFRTGAGMAELDMSVGVHSGNIDLFLAGGSHRELVVTGPAVSQTLSLESLAQSGEILVSTETARAIDPSAVGAGRDDAFLLRRDAFDRDAPKYGEHRAGLVDPGIGLPVALHGHLGGSKHEGEHRLAVIGFLKYGGIDTLLAERGPDVVAATLDTLISSVQQACDAQGVTFLATDVDKDGGKIILAAGTPTASTDDEDRLLHAARDVLDRQPPIPVRIGVNRGRIFAVDLGGQDRRCFTVMGDAVNLAARIMGKAAWGELLASDDVLSKVRTDFECSPVEPFMVKGKSQPVHARLVGSAMGGRQLDDELPLIGRAEELAVIREALTASHHGEGRIVELVGEPGIGKSRIVAAVRALPHGAPTFTIEAGRYSLATPYFALRRALRQAVGAGYSDSAEVVTTALARTVSDVAPELEPWLPLLGVPLGLELLDTPETARLDPAYRQAMLHDSVTKLLWRLLPGPTLVIVEDAHWLDGASIDLLQQLVRDIGRRPWVVLVTRRDVSTGLQLADDQTLVRLRLTPLPQSAATSLASAAAHGASLPPRMLEELVERSGGNPLFLQELVMAAALGPLTELPDSVEAVVAATIDTLPPVDQTLLCQASILGHKFPTDVLAAMVESDPASLDGDLVRLGHFLHNDGDGMARFRHVLLRDVAYERLPFRTRRALHGQAGVIFERSAGDDAENLAELLSIHFHAAGRFHQSWRYSRIAGERASRNAAPIEAAAFYGRALEAARRMRDVEPAKRADVAERLGDALQLSGRYDQAANAYGYARRVARGDPLLRANLCRKTGYLRDREGRFSDAIRWFNNGFRSLDVAPMGPEADQRRARLSTAYGSTLRHRGQYEKAVKVLEDAAVQAELAGERDALAHACQVVADIYIGLGRLTPARARSEQALKIYEDLGDELGQGNALNELGIVAYNEGRWTEAVKYYERSAEAMRRAGALVENAMVLCNLGELRCYQGLISEAEGLLQEAYSTWRSGGHLLGTGYALSELGTAAARDQRFEEAEQLLHQARELLSEIGGEGMLLETEVRDLERLVLAGDHDAALQRAGELERRVAKLGSTAPLVAAFDRLVGYAWCQAGDMTLGWSKLETSLRRNRENGVEYEAALSLEGLGRVGSLLDTRGSEKMLREAETIFARLGVVQSPAVPLPERSLLAASIM